jgi:hypothetical protein
MPLYSIQLQLIFNFCSCTSEVKNNIIGAEHIRIYALAIFSAKVGS